MKKINVKKYNTFKKYNIIKNFNHFKKLIKKYNIHHVKRNNTIEIENACNLLLHKIIIIQAHIRRYICQKKYNLLLSTHKFPIDTYINTSSILGNSIEEIEDDYFVNIKSSIHCKYYFFDIRELYTIISHKNNKTSIINTLNAIHDAYSTESDTDTDTDTDDIYNNNVNIPLFTTKYRTLIKNPYDNTYIQEDDIKFILDRIEYLKSNKKQMNIEDDTIPEDSLLTTKIMEVVSILNDYGLYPDINIFYNLDMLDYVNVIDIILKYPSIKFYIKTRSLMEIHRFYHDDTSDEECKKNIKNTIINILLDLIKINDIYKSNRCLIIYNAIQFNDEFVFDEERSIINYDFFLIIRGTTVSPSTPSGE
jgi:hypothetical protein